jgi:hypothetical protein
LKIVFLIVGILLVVLGAHWVGQGTGWFIWPGNPMMNNHVEWTYAGLASLFGGIGLVTVFILGR